MSGQPHVLLIRRRYLGDIVLLGSVIANLRLRWPAAKLSMLTEQAYAGVVPLHPGVDDALTFPTRATEWPGFIRRLRRARFTHVLDFDNTEKTALVTWFTSASVRATFHRELIPLRYRLLYTQTAAVTNTFYDTHHITETYLALPAAIGIPVVSRDVKLVPQESDLAAARKLAPAGGRKLLLHPGSRSRYRIWPAENFAAVCDRLQDERDVQVFLTAGPNEQPLLDEIRRHARTHLVTIKSVSHPRALAALIAQFDVFLCHDSGPMHIAAGVGTPVVALFGSQNATIWRPLGREHTVLQTELPCRCIGDQAPDPCVRDDSYRSYCVRRLTQDTVFAAVAAALERGRRP